MTFKVHCGRRRQAPLHSRKIQVSREKFSKKACAGRKARKGFASSGS